MVDLGILKKLLKCIPLNVLIYQFSVSACASCATFDLNLLQSFNEGSILRWMWSCWIMDSSLGVRSGTVGAREDVIPHHDCSRFTPVM